MAKKSKTKPRKPVSKKARKWINPNDPVLTLVSTQRGLSSKLAELCGIASPNAPHAWTRVPAEHVRKVSEFLGIACHLIRPDVFAAPRR
jgi:hypothetical protein